jgi:cellulose synthase/poly-beta-1,6-N-acetylglucosamine synthase-like glycosyltransferase
MGRVVPMNTPETYLTRIMDLERSGGYQVDQQARYNLDLLPQFGGTVGGFRRSALKAAGGWDATILAEDTDLTYQVFLRGWKVNYVNFAECYEETVSTWDQKHRQLRRWAIGHNQCLFKHFFRTLKTPILNWKQKLDGILLLGVYVAPVLMLIGWFLGIISYLFEAPWWSPFFPALLFTLSYNNVGNFAVFNEVGGSVVLDKRGRSIRLLPLTFFNFFAYVLICTTAFLDSIFLQAGKIKGEKKGTGTGNHNNGTNNGKNDNNGKNRWDKTKRNGNAIRYYNNNHNGNHNNCNHKNGRGDEQ